MAEEILYTPEELSKILKLSKYTVYEMIKRGDIEAHHIGRSIRVSESQLQLYFIKTRKSENVFDVDITMDGTSTVAIKQQTKIYVSCDFSGPAKISISPEDIILSAKPLVCSARNVLKGTVTDIIYDDLTAKVLLDIGIPLISIITKGSMLDMNISKGSVLYAVFKAMSVKVVK